MTACPPDSLVSAADLVSSSPSYPSGHSDSRYESTYDPVSSELLIAIINPKTGRIEATNRYFQQVMGVEEAAFEEAVLSSLKLLSQTNLDALSWLLKAQLLRTVLVQRYRFAAPLRSLHQPVLAKIASPRYPHPRYIQFTLCPHSLRVDTHPDCDPLDGQKIECLSVDEQRSLANDPAWIDHMVRQIDPANLILGGAIALEGVDVTAQENIRRITQLLVNRDSIASSLSFSQLNEQMCQLFRAENTIIAGIDRNRVRLFSGSISEEIDDAEYTLDELKGQPIVQAIETDRVVTVPDLALIPQTEGSKQMLAMGNRSLLLMPLIAKTYVAGQNVRNPIGAIVVISNEVHHFDGVDCKHAEQLIPSFTMALTNALRQVQQRQFTSKIHAAVEWRFAQEAERRSWGLPSESIAFANVYPLYGVSDIRGSSHERNRAIQEDLLAQFDLAIAVVKAAYDAEGHALCQQMLLDLEEKAAELRQGITVDTEVTAAQYLQERVEANFTYFCHCSPAAHDAVLAYQRACSDEHGVVYGARDRYDVLLNQFNTQLRQVWDDWQVKMQAIVPHYCDVEATDGIDHMIYAGASINAGFSPFHLRSLRYEQLRGICHCARRAFEIRDEFDTQLEMTHLVLVQDQTVDIFHNERNDRPFEVRGTRDTRYEIVKKRIDKAVDQETRTRITQPGQLTVVYSTGQERQQYEEYLRYLQREGWIGSDVEDGTVEPLQGVKGLKYLRVQILPRI
ncbi:MAG: GAF domain-containing protein [Elainellaceae cyanobacterium]